jgi:hypothetical protein
MGLYFSQAVIWVKEHPVLTRKDFMGNHEWCFYGWREGAAHRFFGPNNAVDVWSVKKVNPQSMIHCETRMKRRAHSVNVVTRSSGCPRSRASWPSRSANRGAFEGGVDFAWDSARIAVELMALYTLQRQGPAEKYEESPWNK